MLAAVDIVKAHQQVGINAIHIKLRGRGGVGVKTPGPGAQSAIRALARNGLKIGRVEDVTPIPTDQPEGRVVAEVADSEYRDAFSTPPLQEGPEAHRTLLVASRGFSFQRSTVTTSLSAVPREKE